jgi:hypothetical protein
MQPTLRIECAPVDEESGGLVDVLLQGRIEFERDTAKLDLRGRFGRKPSRQTPGD